MLRKAPIPLDHQASALRNFFCQLVTADAGITETPLHRRWLCCSGGEHDGLRHGSGWRSAGRHAATKFQEWAAGATPRSLAAMARSDADSYAVELAQRTVEARHAASIAPIAPTVLRGVKALWIGRLPFPATRSPCRWPPPWPMPCKPRPIPTPCPTPARFSLVGVGILYGWTKRKLPKMR